MPKKKKKVDLDAALRRVAAIKEKWNITDEEEGPPQVKKPKPKKKQKSWIQSVLDRFRLKKKRKGITLPAGVRTPEQIAEWEELMGIRKRKQ